MIGRMELTSRDAVLPFLEAGFDTVGTHVDVYHLAAAPIGAVVTFTAEAVAVDGRRIQFRVEAWDEKEKIGEGTHERAVINVAKFATRLAEKKPEAWPPAAPDPGGKPELVSLSQKLQVAGRPQACQGALTDVPFQRERESDEHRWRCDQRAIVLRQRRKKVSDVAVQATGRIRQ